MLAAIAVAREVREGAIGRRYGGIFLFYAASHFRDQGFLQRRRRGKHVIGVAVLVLEVLADCWVKQARVAHDPLPVWVLEPGKFVSEDNAMPACLDRRSGRNRERLDGRYRTGRANSGTVGHRGQGLHLTENVRPDPLRGRALTSC